MTAKRYGNGSKNDTEADRGGKLTRPRQSPVSVVCAARFLVDQESVRCVKLLIVYSFVLIQSNLFSIKHQFPKIDCIKYLVFLYFLTNNMRTLPSTYRVIIR